MHAGYGWSKNNIYVGGAVSDTQGSLSETSALTEDLYSSGSTSTVRYNHQIAIDLNVGNGDDQFCFFGLLCLQKTIAFTVASKDNSIKPHFMWGPHLGIGGHVALADNVMLLLSLTYSLYFDVWQKRSGTINVNGITIIFRELKRYIGCSNMMQAEATMGVSYALPVRY